MSVADFIIQIKNGYMARRESISMPYSRFNESLLMKLKKLQYIDGYSIDGEIVKRVTVYLKYEEEVPALTDVKLFSTPGRRWYLSYSDIKPVLGGLGKAIVSTPKGLLTGAEAQREKVGGELLFHIW
jgi:small subunit ribosomal protein S8